MIQDEFEMENQGYEEEVSPQASGKKLEYSEKSRISDQAIPIERVRDQKLAGSRRNSCENHVYEDIGISFENSTGNSFPLPMENYESEKMSSNFHRNLTLPLRRATESENDPQRYSVRITNRERTRYAEDFPKINEIPNDSPINRSRDNFSTIRDSGRFSSINYDSNNFSKICEAEKKMCDGNFSHDPNFVHDQNFQSVTTSHVVDKPGRRRRKKDCKHCKSKANGNLQRQAPTQDHISTIDLESQISRTGNSIEEKSRLGFEPIFAIDDSKLPIFQVQNYESPLPESRNNSIFSISNNAHSGCLGNGPKPLNYEKNETDHRLVSVELNDERALITPQKNHTGMKVNSIYSQDYWRDKDSPIFLTDVKEQHFQRAYSLPTRTHTPSSQNRVNLRRSVRGEPPPHPAQLRKNRHGWTLHFARPLDGTGCTRSIVLLLIAILTLLGIGGLALYIVFEPEKLQIIQQYLRSSGAPNATQETNSTLVIDTPENFESEMKITTLSSIFMPSTDNSDSTDEITWTTETGTEISTTTTTTTTMTTTTVTTTTTTEMSTNVTRYCDDCYQNEVCVALVGEEVPICRTGPDPLDPTGCNGLCLINKQKCHRLDFDAFRCVELEHYCLDDEWTCSNSLCIPLVKHCDGHMNCYDHSDEYNCTCDLETHFQCGNETSCLPLEKRCDGKIDCWDATDEINCTLACPSSSEFTCSNGECILKARFCDGLRDCNDGSDEPHGCQGRCNKHEFSCLNGRCITKGMKCNGVDDCGDGSDEKHCRDRAFSKPVT